MTTLADLAIDQRQTLESYLLARPFTEREREYWQLCWMQVTQVQLDAINADMPPSHAVTARELDGNLYINIDLMSDAINDGRLAEIWTIVEDLSWEYIDPWQWEAENDDTEAWQSYDGTPATIYQVGDVVLHVTKKWVSTTPTNVWEPSVFGWREVTVGNIPPTWRQPLGAGDAWDLNDVVLWENKQWKSLVPNNVWRPGTNATLWQDVTETEPEEPTVQAWSQGGGTGTAGSYNLGDRVTHDNPNDSGNIWIYESAIPANTTQPGRDGTFDRWWTPIEVVQ